MDPETGKHQVLDDDDNNGAPSKEMDQAVPIKQSYGCGDVDEIEDYEKAVARAFRVQPEKHILFEQTIDAYLKDKIAAKDVIEMMDNLFQEHDSLRVQLNPFLCLKYERVTGTKRVVPFNTVDYDCFINLVKERFTDEPDKFGTFVSAHMLHLEHKITAEDMRLKIIELLQGQDDLLATYKNQLVYCSIELE